MFKRYVDIRGSFVSTVFIPCFIRTGLYSTVCLNILEFLKIAIDKKSFTAIPVDFLSFVIIKCNYINVVVEFLVIKHFDIKMED